VTREFELTTAGCSICRNAGLVRADRPASIGFAEAQDVFLFFVPREHEFPPPPTRGRHDLRGGTGPGDFIGQDHRCGDRVATPGKWIFAGNSSKKSRVPWRIVFFNQRSGRTVDVDERSGISGASGKTRGPRVWEFTHPKLRDHRNRPGEEAGGIAKARFCRLSRSPKHQGLRACRRLTGVSPRCWPRRSARVMPPENFARAAADGCVRGRGTGRRICRIFATTVA